MSIKGTDNDIEVVLDRNEIHTTINLDHPNISLNFPGSLLALLNNGSDIDMNLGEMIVMHNDNSVNVEMNILQISIQVENFK